MGEDFSSAPRADTLSLMMPNQVPGGDSPSHGGSATGSSDSLPSALAAGEEIIAAAGSRSLVLFLDYDGTLTPIVERPELAVLGDGMRQALAAAATRFPVAVVSGRDLDNVRRLVAVEGIAYAGSHGFDIELPGGVRSTHRTGEEFLPLLDDVEADLLRQLAAVEGAQVERKTFSVAVHYRRVNPERAAAVERAVDAVLASRSRLRKKGGKKVFEIQPDIDWDKGRAVLWLLGESGWAGENPFPVYIGDDLTDEDAFQALQGRGVGIIVCDEPRPTAAAYTLASTEETRTFLEGLVSRDRPTDEGP